MKVNPHKSSLGMDANVLALLCYIAAFVLAWIPLLKFLAWGAPLVIFLIEKDSPFVKFHAMQAFLINVLNSVLGLIFYIIQRIAISAFIYSALYYGSYGVGYWVASILSWIVFAVVTVFAIIGCVKAGQYFEYKIPGIGDLAMKFSRKNGAPIQ